MSAANKPIIDNECGIRIFGCGGTRSENTGFLEHHIRFKYIYIVVSTVWKGLNEGATKTSMLFGPPWRSGYLRRSREDQSTISCPGMISAQRLQPNKPWYGTTKRMVGGWWRLYKMGKFWHYYIIHYTIYKELSRFLRFYECELPNFGEPASLC